MRREQQEAKRKEMSDHRGMGTVRAIARGGGCVQLPAQVSAGFWCGRVLHTSSHDSNVSRNAVHGYLRPTEQSTARARRVELWMLKLMVFRFLRFSARVSYGFLD